MYFVLKKYKFFKQDQYEIVKSKSHPTEAEAKKFLEASQTLNDNKDVSFFIIEQVEEASQQMELPFPELRA